MTFLSSDPVYKKVEALFNSDTHASIYHFAIICQPRQNAMEFIIKRETLSQVFIQPYNPHVLLMFEGRLTISPENFVRYKDMNTKESSYSSV